MNKSIKKDAIYVNNPDILEDIVQSTIRNNKKYNYNKLNNSSNNNYNINKIKQQNDELIKDNDKILHNNIRKLIDKKNTIKHNKFMESLNIIEISRQDVNDIDQEIQVYADNKRSKTKRLYDDWNKNVHNKIQLNINKQIDQSDSNDLHIRKLNDYDKYINITNSKAAIFNDIIIESEYDPLEPNRHCIKAKVNKLNDPTKLNQLKAELEQSMLDPSYKPNTKTLSKYTLPVQQWATGKIEATPYGMPPKTMSEMSKRRTHSNIIFDHFDYPKNNEYINNEMPVGKRTFIK